VSQTVQTSFRFSISSLAADALEVVHFTGEEEISRPFRFELLLAATDPALDLAGLVGETAQFTLDKDGAERILYGIVAEFYQTDMPVPGVYLYRAVLVPRLSRLQLSRQNQIYGTTLPLDVIGVVTAELGESAQQGGVARHGTLGLLSTDFDVRVTGSYPARDYIVQYDETDFDFIARQLEHWGIFYFFDHSTGTDRIVLGDNNVNFGQIAAPQDIRYTTAGGMSSAGTASVFEFFCRTKQVPTQVTLRDYNYRLPKLELLVQETVDPAGFGWVNEYDGHFRTPAEGMVLAKIRAEEMLCRQTVYSGKSDCIRFEAGRSFGLTDHFRASFNREYLITGIRHQGAQGVYGVSLNGPAGQLGYSNSFTAIPADTPFRPERITRRPKIAGVMTGRIDGVGDGTRAEIDELGRYKVLLQFDLGGYPAGQASQYIRKAEPYSGLNSGMHFPLLKGTEVLLAHIDGDPDRPVILGAVPDAASLIVSNQGSNDRNRVVTPSGIFMEMNDGQGSGGGSAGSGGSGGALQQQAMGGADGSSTDSGVNAWQPPSNGLYNQSGSGGGTWFRFGEPTNNGYFRIGSYDPTTESGLLPRMMCDNAPGGKSGGSSGSSTGGGSTGSNAGKSYAGGTSGGAGGALMAAPLGEGTSPPPGSPPTATGGGSIGYGFSSGSGSTPDTGGALAFANGNSYTKTVGDKIDDISGDKITQVDGNQYAQVNKNDWKWVSGTSTNTYGANYTSTYMGPYEAFSLSNKLQITTGFAEDIMLGGKLGVVIGAEVKCNIGSQNSYYLGSVFKNTTGSETSILEGPKTETILVGPVTKTVTSPIQTNIYTGVITNTYTGVVNNTYDGITNATNLGDVNKEIVGIQTNVYEGNIVTTLQGAIVATQTGAKIDMRDGIAYTQTNCKIDEQTLKIDLTTSEMKKNDAGEFEIVQTNAKIAETKTSMGTASMLIYGENIFA
jgi:type VI secretion system VgrG family protein